MAVALQKAQRFIIVAFGRRKPQSLAERPLERNAAAKLQLELVGTTF